MSSRKPNIIVFFSDQQRWDTVGSYGQPLNVTPNLDAMAAQGIRFENAFTCQPVCGPARSCIQSGMVATRTGCYRNGVPLPLNTKTIAHYLSEVGYDVGYVGKWHLASDDKEFDYRTGPVPTERRGGYKDWWTAADILEFTSHGYDGYIYGMNNEKLEFKGYRPDCITDYALDYIGSRSADKPFFLFLSHIEPHHQNDHNRYEGPEGSKEKFKDYSVPGDLKGTQGDWRENYPDYLGCCNSLDDNLGRIRDRLKELGMDQNTIVIYTSDHGTHFRTRNAEYKRSCHDGCIRIPFVIYDPSRPSGVVVDNLVSLIDLPATILTYADIELPEHFDGRPLQQVIEGSDWYNEVFIQISESQVGRAVRTKRWKYSVDASGKDGWGDMDASVYKEQYLYDLENDPHEKNNLVSDPAFEEIRRELAGVLKSRMVQAGEPEPEIVKA